jgi:NCAIR mutase (PurE)-related protein
MIHLKCQRIKIERLGVKPAMMEIEHILKLVQSGGLDILEAQIQIQQHLAKMSDAESDLGFANLDLEREKRTGFPEVIFGEGKSVDQIIAITSKFMQHCERVLATRVDPIKAEAVVAAIPSVTYHPAARALTWFKKPILQVYDGYIAVVCAGTSDLPVAEEAAITAECMGSHVERIYDVGVAGIHRLFKKLPLIRGANSIVVVAGMEGALASVVGGLVDKPIIAVPTSIGYGASFHGIAALLAMLNSCAPGISVVNIDNGFGAGYNASLIQQNIQKRLERL